MPTRKPQTTRREMLSDSGRLTVGAAFLAGVAPVHSGVDETIRVALVGCGGRGSGAARNALSVKRGPMKLVAMADVFENRLQQSFEVLTRTQPEQMDVPPERRFLGFDAYRKTIDCLGPGDVVIFATPPAFRWVHFQYAIEKGVHVFMEKPVTVDGPTSKRMLELGSKAEAKGLKVGVGLMGRHSRAFEQLVERVRGGELGEIISQRGYRMQGPIVFFRSLPKPEGINELMYQVQRFHSFLWASGGAFNDFFIHIVDHLCWMKGAWPVSAQALGGRHYRHADDGTRYIDQNLDTYSVEYTYADGTKFLFGGRNQSECQSRFSSYIHGTKGAAVVSASGDYGYPSSIHEGHQLDRKSIVWKSEVPDEDRNPYQNEWEDLVAAIRDNTPYNEVPHGVHASAVCNMGRMAAHTGREVSFEELMNCPHEFAPGLDQITADSPAPLQKGPDGNYPVPQPGLKKDREY